MRLPGGEHAIADVAKLRDYCLNPFHPRGRHKSRVFESALGLVAADAEFLREELLRAAREGESTPGDIDDYGQRYTVDFALIRGERQATIRSAWIILAGEQVPRLTSCYVLLD
jgi:hypothetical protein